MEHALFYALFYAYTKTRQTSFIVVWILVSHLKVLSVTYILHYISFVLQDFTKHNQSPVYMNGSHICIGLTENNATSISVKRSAHTEYVIGLTPTLLKMFSQFDLFC